LEYEKAARIHPCGFISEILVTPEKAGVQMLFNYLTELDSGFRRNDGRETFRTFCDFTISGF
jgi:hypothetical protein